MKVSYDAPMKGQKYISEAKKKLKADLWTAYTIPWPAHDFTVEKWEAMLKAVDEAFLILEK